jgi:biotin operon repressor
MVNIGSSGLSEDERRFIDEVAALLAPRGMPTSAGRVYGYVLLNEAPVSLEQIAAQLDMSKGGAWTAAKTLERCGQVRRYGERGSKRALYGPTENYDAAMLEQSALMGAMGALMQESAALRSGRVARRLEEMAGFYLGMRETIEAGIRELSARRARRTA